MDLPSLEPLVLDTWRGWLHEFHRCRRHASAPAVHHVRVESRRAMAVLALFDTDGHPETRRVRKAVKATLDALSKLRDAHVQRAGAKKLIGKHPAARPFIKYLDHRERRLREAVSADLDRVHVRAASRACTRLAHDGAHRTPVVVARMARQAIAAAWDEVEERMQALDAADSRTIHRVRVALKRVRYMLEAGLGVDALDPRTKALDAAELADSVHRMGRLHDTETLLERLDTFARKGASEAVAVASLHATLSRRRGQLLRGVMADVPMLRAIHASPRRSRAALASQAPQRRGR
jgi:CHAD domain-containing protein